MRIAILAVAGVLVMSGSTTLAAEPVDAKAGPTIMDDATMDRASAGFGSPILKLDLGLRDATKLISGLPAAGRPVKTGGVLRVSVRRDSFSQVTSQITSFLDGSDVY
jgi:hypothetical protein